jgi:hypothetical protein
MKKAVLALLLFTIVFSGKISAQLTGIKNIPGDYPTLAAAITDLNTQGVGVGGVIFNHIAGFPETAPAGGYQITTNTSTAANSVAFLGNGNTITASAAHTVGAINDAVFKIIGADYIGIQGYIIQENPANTVSTPVASNNMTEWGIALLYQTATNGAQGNAIVGNTISLNRSYANTWGIYSNTRHTATSVTATADASSPAGANSLNTVLQNTISNVNMGIAFIGVPASANSDLNNVIGSPTMGNVITNWGGAPAVSGYVSNSGTSYCIFMNHQRNSAVRGNTVSTTSAMTTGTLRGIVQDYTSTSPTLSALNYICQNTISIVSAQTSGNFRMIAVANGSNSVNMTVDSNIVQNCAITGVASSSILTGIHIANNLGGLLLRQNRVLSNTSTATTGGFSGITITSTMGGNFDINNNKIGNATTDAITFSAATSGAVNGIAFTGSGGAGVGLGINDNTFHGFVFSVTASCAVNVIQQTGAVGFSFVNNNIFDNISLNTSAAVTMINNNAVSAAGSSSSVSGNSIVGSFSKSAAGAGALILVDANAAIGAGSTRVVQNNIFSNVSSINSGIIGINETGGAVSGAVSRVITGNTINNWSAGAAITVLDVNRTSAGSVLSNNTITNITSTSGALVGIAVDPLCLTDLSVFTNTISNLTGAGSVTMINIQAATFSAGIEVANNVLNGATSSGATSSVIGISNASSGPDTIYSNTIFDLNCVAASPAYASGISGSFSGTTSAIHNNKIYDIENTVGNGIAAGVTILNATSVHVYNNYVGDIRTPNSTTNASARGIDVQNTTGATQVSYNTVYISGTSGSAGFGSSCILATTSTAFTMRNNLFVNLATPTGTGRSVALTFNGTSLANFQAASNNNALYAGVPSASNLIFYDGTNSDQTLAAYQTRVAPRESNAITENPVFSSIVGSAPDYLHIPAATPSFLESGGTTIAGITTDWDADVRPGPAGSVNGGAVAPDIGADEFDGILMTCSGTPNGGTAITTSPASQCPGNTFDLELTGHSTGPPFTYQWQESTVSGGPYTNIPGATSDTYTTVALSSTMYYVCVVTCTVSGLSATSTQQACTIYPAPVITFSPAAPSFCAGAGPVTVVASGANSYVWTPATGLSSTTINNPDANPASTTTYTVVGTSVDGCTSSNTVTVTVNPLPSVGVSASPNPLCLGSTSVLTGSGALTYIWMPMFTSGPTENVSPASTSTYTVQGTDGNGCTNTATITVTVVPTPTVTASADFTTVCSGSPVTLTGSGATSYVWNPGSVSGSPVVVNPTANTTYTVIGTDVSGCTGTDMVSITVNPAPSVSATATPPAICAGDVTTLDGFGASSYLWMPGSLTGSSVVVSPASTTTYTVTGTDGFGCTGTSTVMVTVNPLPTVTASASPSAICTGGSTSLSATGANGYVWIPGFQVGTPVTESPMSTTTYTVVGTDINGCSSQATTTVTVNSPPSVTASATPSTICQGSSVTLNGSGASTYLWMPGSLSGSSVTDTPASTTTYTVTGTDVNGCTGTATTMVTVNPAPTVGVSASATTICQGSFTMLTATGATTYSWMPGSLSGGSVIVSPTATTTYTVTGTDGSGCTSSATITINVNPRPIVSISGANTYCQGGSTLLTSNLGPGYQWYLNGFQIPGATSQTYAANAPGVYNVMVTLLTGCSDTAAVGITMIENPLPTVSFTASPGLVVCQGTMVTLSGTGATSYSWTGGITNGVPFAASTTTTYTVTGTDVNGCTNTATATLNVNPLPTVSSTAAPSTSVCAGSSVTLTGSGASTYSWTGGVTDGVPFTPASTQTYTVTGTDLAGCTGTNTITVTVNPLPTVSFTAAPSTTVCTGSSVTLSGTGATSYSWSGGITNAVAFTPASTQTYTVIGTDGNGCTGTATATVTVNPSPTVSFTAVPSTTVCSGTSVTLSGTGATSYTWTGGVTNGVAFTPASTTTYTVTGTDAGGCTNTATVTVTVNPLPTVGSTASPSATVCTGGSLTLNGTGASTYTWSGGVTNGVSFVPPATTTYTVTGTDGNGCTNTSTILVTVNPVPTVGATASPGTTVCSGTSVTLNGTGAVSYIWSGGVTNGVPFVPASTTSYVVTGTNGSGCTNTATITITVNPLPTVGSTVSPSSTVCAGAMVTLSGTGATSYTWTGGVTNGVPFAAVSTTTYTVTGTDVNGCTNTATTTITVNPTPTVTASASPGTSICSGSSVTLNGGGAVTYTWSGGVTNGVAFTPPSTNTYTVTGTNAGGCTGTATITITVNPQPSISSTASPGTTVCSGTAVTLNGTGGVTYTWSGGVTNGVAFTPASTTTYTVTGTDASGCTNTATTTITVNPAPTITSGVSPSNTVCQGTMITLNGFGGTSYSWSHSVTNGVPFAASTTTTYTVTGTDMNGCTGTSTITIFVSPTPTISAIQSPAGPQCVGSTVTLNGIGGVSYTWCCGVTNGVGFVPPSTATYTVTGSNMMGCTNTATITVVINPLPTVSSTATPGTTVCSGTPVTLNGTGASTYSWTGGVTNGVAFTPVSTQTYTVTGTDGNGCQNTATTTITVNPAPVVTSTAAPATTVCAGTSVTLTGSGAVSYAWTGGVTDGVAFTPVSTQTYTVTGTAANGCTSTATTTITVNPIPVVGSVIAPAPTVCSGSPVALNGTGATTYTWTGGVTDGVPFIATTTATYTVTGTDVNGCTGTATTTLTVYMLPAVSYIASPSTSVCAGTLLTLDGTGASTYTYSDTTILDGQPFIPAGSDTVIVTGTDINGCTNTDSIFIVVNTPPVVTTAFSPNDTVCENAQVTLMGVGATSYTWSHGVTDNVPFSATTTTTYTVIGSDGFGCSDTTTQQITVIAAPVVTITGNSTFCTGGNTVLTASAGSSYQWFMNGSPITGSTSSTYTATAAGVYNVWVVSASGCGDSSATSVNVTINTPPTVVANATATSICEGSPVTLTGSGASAYAWSGSVNDGVAFIPSGTMTYTVVGTALNGCTDSDTITIVVNALPTVTTSAIPSNVVCAGTSVTLSGNGAATYLWTGGVVDGVPFTPVMTSTYIVTGTDTNSCSNTATVTVTVNANPIVNIGPDSTNCGAIMLDAGNVGSTYLWSTSATTQTISATVSGTYMVDVTNASGCTSSDTVVLTINTQPVVNLGADDTLCAASITLDAMNVGGSYVWNDFSTGQTNVVTTSGTYFVQVTMPGGCVGSDTITLVVNTPPNVTLTLPLDTACLNMGAVTLSGESPAGGTWSGPAVSGNTFDPMIAGLGTFGITYTYTDVNGCTGSAIDSLLVDACMSVIDPVVTMDFNMYPNPNNGEFSLELNITETADMIIYNANGEVVISKQINGGEITPISLEASGIYMVTIITQGGEQLTKRVVVNR